MKAIEVFQQNNGDVTKHYYAELDAIGPIGQIATALFRAQKRSTAAKSYRGRRFKSAAYDVKTWSMGELCRLLKQHAGALGIRWGWKPDPNQALHSQVLYVELPQGQVSFHSSDRCGCPDVDFAGEWDGQHKSTERILAFCDAIGGK